MTGGENRVSPTARTRIAAVLSVALAAAFTIDARAQQTPPAQQAAAPQQADAKLSNERLEQLVAPIALYPDSLMAQVLMASTYPLEIVQAARWAKDNPKLTGKALEDKLATQPWDASVKSIVAVPQVLTMMNDKLDWTQNLGNAFLAQQEDVLAAVQRLRVKAEDKGTLKTTPQQTVRKESSGGSQAIVIEPANPEVVYVPTYDPGVVYGAWPYPAYPPYSWYPPGYVASNVVSFGLGVAAGAALWGSCNWWRGNVDINVNRYNNFNRTNISNSEWRHDASHRKGVSYGNSRVAERYGKGASARDTAAREQFRGRAESGNLNLGGRDGAGRDGPRRDGSGPGRDGPGRDGAGPGRDGPGRDGPGRDGAGRQQQRDASANRDRQGGARQSGGGDRAGSRGGNHAQAFSGAGNGAQARRDSSRGQASRQASQIQHRAAAPRPSGGGARSYGGGGGRSFSAGGGGGRSFGGGGRGGGGRGGRR